MEREAVLVGIDVGTTKVCALIGEVNSEGALTIIGKGSVPATGLKKGMIVNIEQTINSIAQAVEQAERLSGWKIDRAFVGVGGQNVESQNSRGAVAVSGHDREVSREDINRATEVARAVSIPSNREVLHVLPRGFIVDGQEGVKDPLGMSALRLEVETHIVTASATAVQNLQKCVMAADVKIDELVAASLASAEAVLTENDKDLGVGVADIGAGTIDLALFADGSPYYTSVLPVGGNNVTMDIAAVLRTSLQVAEELKVRHGTCDLRSVDAEEMISVSVLGEDAGRSISRMELCQIIEARTRETLELVRNEMQATGHGRLPAGRRPDRRRGPAGRPDRARPGGPRDVRPGRRTDRRQRARRQPPDPGLQHLDRAAPLGRRGHDVGRAGALRVDPRGRPFRPGPGRLPERLSLIRRRSAGAPYRSAGPLDFDAPPA